jgi:hypothetical protein
MSLRGSDNRDTVFTDSQLYTLGAAKSSGNVLSSLACRSATFARSQPIVFLMDTPSRHGRLFKEDCTCRQFSG